MNNIISTRIRFARNLPDFPFPSRLGAQRKEVMLKIKDAVKEIYPEWDFIDTVALTDIQMGAFIEQRLASPEFSERKEGSGLILSKDRSICIMINEEDHLRIQVFSKGEDIRETYAKAKTIDEQLDKKLHFAYSDKLGYLTQCPTNLGTAMRASVLVHLPMLGNYGAISSVTNTANQYGLTVRGVYGEGTRAAGHQYQISNSLTLGYSEEDIIQRMTAVIDMILKNEQKLADQIPDNIAAQDRIFRAYGILKQARILTSDEAVNLLSDLRCGVEAGILDIDTAVIDSLMIKIQPCNIAMNGVKNRDTARAEMVRTALS